ncbi:MAG: folate-binding protein YgfZ [Candidatus Kapaibacterium sp.]
MQLYRPGESEYVSLTSRAAFAKLNRGVIRGVGSDRLDLLHRLSTGDVGNLKTGQERTTILTTEKGRILEVLRVVAMEDHILLLLEGSGVEGVRSWLDKYTIMDDFETSDVSEEYALVGLYGMGVRGIVSELFGVSIPKGGDFTEVDVDGERALLLRDVGLAGPEGALLVVNAGKLSALIAMFVERGVEQLSEETRQVLRVEAGKGEINAELSGDYNPLEAGLVSHVSFTKGCYIGQEVIARLDTYDKVKRRLIGVKVHVDDAEKLTVDGEIAIREVVGNEPVGILTTLASSPQHGLIGLGYIRAAYAIPDLDVELFLSENPEHSIATGKLAMLPF